MDNFLVSLKTSLLNRPISNEGFTIDSSLNLWRRIFLHHLLTKNIKTAALAAIGINISWKKYNHKITSSISRKVTSKYILTFAKSASLFNKENIHFQIKIFRISIFECAYFFGWMDTVVFSELEIRETSWVQTPDVLVASDFQGVFV